jgi:hypothetical protein
MPAQSQSSYPVAHGVNIPAMVNMSIDANGVARPERSIATYAAGYGLTTFAALATDIWQLIGSATKTVAITRIQITADATGLGAFDYALFKRITANTNGTISPIDSISYDSLDPVATAIVRAYTTSPTLGTGTIIRIDSTALPGAAATGYPYAPTIWDFSTRNAKPVLLRGIGESIAINLQPVSAQPIPPGLAMYIDVEFCEY